MVHLLLLASIMLVGNGCARRSQNAKLDKNAIAYSNCSYPIFSDEERLVDIPLPGSQILYNITSTHDPRKLALIYKTDFKLEDIIAFYRLQMECLGWQEAEIIKGYHTCLLFKKPSKVCSIILKSSKSLTKNSSTVTLFISPKK
ncbi:hypothetical protein H0X48_01835 [Candidatus Dependentiae bacterium]|nr:hypothetical protein [Candidatus Dependentiae bacterium]